MNLQNCKLKILRQIVLSKMLIPKQQQKYIFKQAKPGREQNKE